MRRLLIIRHGKSRWDLPFDSDWERPLAPRGIKAAGRMAGWITEQQLQPEMIVSSTAKRALSTARLLSERLGNVTVREEDSIYEASVADLYQVIHAVPDQLNTVMLVGHNYGLEYFVDDLIDRDDTTLKTCSLAVLHSDAGSWHELARGSCTRQALIHPRDLKKPVTKD